jgi:hypothetical protein
LNFALVLRGQPRADYCSVIRRSLTIKRWVTPESVIGPRLARTRRVNPAVRAVGDFLNGINLMLAVQSCLQKYFGSHNTPNHF